MQGIVKSCFAFFQKAYPPVIATTLRNKDHGCSQESGMVHTTSIKQSCTNLMSLSQFLGSGSSSRVASSSHSLSVSALLVLEGLGAFPFLNCLTASAISLRSGISSDISKEGMSIRMASGVASFVYKLIRSSVTFWRSSWNGAGDWPEAWEYQHLVIVQASLALSVLNSASASGPAVAHQRLGSLAKKSFRGQLMKLFAVWLKPGEQRSAFF